MKLLKWTTGYILVLALASWLSPFLALPIALYIGAVEFACLSGKIGEVKYNAVVERWVPDRWKFLTLGRTIWLGRKPSYDSKGYIITGMTVKEKSHELVHVIQWLQYRSLFPILYAHSNLMHSYHGNKFEEAARQRLRSKV